MHSDQCSLSKSTCQYLTRLGHLLSLLFFLQGSVFSCFPGWPVKYWRQSIVYINMLPEWHINKTKKKSFLSPETWISLLQNPILLLSFRPLSCLFYPFTRSFMSLKNTHCSHHRIDVNCCLKFLSFSFPTLCWSVKILLPSQADLNINPQWITRAWEKLMLSGSFLPLQVKVILLYQVHRDSLLANSNLLPTHHASLVK